MIDSAAFYEPTTSLGMASISGSWSSTIPLFGGYDMLTGYSCLCSPGL